MYLSYIHPKQSEAYLWQSEASMIAYHGYHTPNSLAQYLPDSARFAVSLELHSRNLPILQEISVLNVESFHGICDLDGFSSLTQIRILGTKRMPIINIRQPIATITSYHIPPNIKQENVLHNKLINHEGMLKHCICMRTVNLTTENKKILNKSIGICAR